ncbi:helix-turn-helix domain-containing protein [Leptolinea tardivitalis]|uniref:HTH cro/C1-type domain-containing protein n=1 Tax=Leptolinea tardivitalis TaxID=229920 RepID=A0A0P6X011_9CHLR|nr:helix-turn-helix transcriptional regulator [Leptolinea tardivitalis]KPL72488.1 hypothetical protein ADM99_04960 [Leptolinea tardivitalis]GAP21229.1 helix-turn-helix [Leptolinea tardivitalis]
MEAFGLWIQGLRKEIDADLRIVGQLSNLHFTTVSRIEKGLNEPSLDTAIKMATALNGNPAEFYKIASGKNPATPKNSNENQHLYPSLQDVELIEHSFDENPIPISDYITHYLNIIWKLHNKQKDNSFYSIEKSKMDSIRKEIHKETEFSSEEVFKYLLTCDSIIFEPHFKYPNKLPPQLGYEIFIDGGVLLSEEIGRYIEYILEKSDMQKVALNRDTVKKYMRINQTISKLIETTQISSLKLNDIYLLDLEIATNNEIFMMTWNAASEEVRENNRLQKNNAGRLLLTLSRFLALYDHPEPNWLEDLKSL